jgi:cyclophilin family peptidyl-prolyl cis-trans isomerase
MQNTFILSVVLALAVFNAPAGAQQPVRVDTARLQRLLAAEDARGTGVDGITPLTAELHGTDPLLRRVAVRGLGRLQRLDVITLIEGTLPDPVPAVRAEAANAVAQSVSRVRPIPTDSGQADVRSAAKALTGALAAERNDSVAGAVAEALGRLPFADSADVHSAERAILDRARTGITFDVARGLYRLAFSRRITGGLSPRAVALLRDATQPPRDALTRRMAVLALVQQGALDSLTLIAAAGDPDEQVRRFALAGAAGLAPGRRAAIARAALDDQSPIVRIAGVAAARVGTTAPDCLPITALTSARSDYVALTAIDALGLRCAERSVSASVLADVINGTRDVAVPDHAWQRGAHALVALARIDSALVAPFLARFAGSPRWGERMAAANAAASARDIRWLRRLAGDKDNNVRAMAIEGLDSVVAHGADSVCLAALTSPGNQVVLAAAQALAGSTTPGSVPRLLDAFDSLSSRRTENARDPRLELLKRIDELGSTANVARLKPYLADFDTTIAANTATILTKWTGAPVRATPHPLPIQSEPLAALFLAPDIRLRVTMAASSGGGSFTVRLFANEAPATVARIVRLARARYYDGHVFQRVEPNFVIQGGGPDASEYMGDATFMRDELGTRSHSRGTVGISSRGRDTGDAQWFINLADNPRLDHEYTVFGEVIAGRGIVDQILEGDVIAHVEVLGAP